ncbi:hypothetical protein [Labrenzia sp. CP4]|jgi:hypothetical protein|uniref:hypothetical protein n=1 Tax=Labrenzia sp. CP4 TaxID=1674922 RepID=UPI000B00D925|nr:hypothetical protein [Labrenzia sp. CP4]
MADIDKQSARIEECDTPHLNAVRIGASAQLVTAPCPWCGRSHPHGGGTDFKSGEMLVDRGSRVADQCFDDYACKIGPRGYKLIEWTSVANYREAANFFGVLADRPLIARLHPKNGRHSRLMSVIAKTMFPGPRVDAGRCRSGKIVAALDENSRCFYLGRDGSWFVSSNDNETKVLARGDNLLQALALFSGMPASHVAENLLFATTGCVLGHLTGSAFGSLIDQCAGHAEIVDRDRFPGNPEFLLRMIGGGLASPSSQVPPLIEVFFLLMLPGGTAHGGVMEYKNAQRQISTVILHTGDWAGSFPYAGSSANSGQPVRMQGHNLLSLLAALTGLDAGWYAERILTAGLGFDLPAKIRSQLAGGLTEAIGQAAVRDGLEGSE